MTTLVSICFILAFFPALIYLRNTKAFKPPKRVSGAKLQPISVLIPARNESKSIRGAVESVLQSKEIDFEIVVLDDHSEDDTRAIVESIATTDSRVRIESAPGLPEGWCGKQHACYQLSKLAKYDLFAFLDADVRLQPDALTRMVQFLEDSKSDLVSGFPKQETVTLLEKLLIPLIHFILLGFLPIWISRKRNDIGLGAGCGQWFLAKRDAYEKVDGHAAVKTSLHDGVKLPRAFRAAGFKTDLCDVTDLATCRMYRSASEVWFGLAKNAREGLGSPRLLPFFSAIFLLGQVMPFCLLATIHLMETIPVILTIAAVGCSWYPRFDSVIRFRQSLIGAILHPIGILTLLTLQWYANFRVWFGTPSGWKGRSYDFTLTGKSN